MGAASGGFRVIRRWGAVMALTLSATLAGCGSPDEGTRDIVDAVRQNNLAVVASFLSDDGDPDLLSAGGDPLTYIASGPKGGVAVLTMLLAAGGNPNARSRRGRTALQNAASWCDAERVALLISSGAAIDLPGKNNKTPAQSVCIAPAGPRARTIAVLKAAGASGF